MTSESETMKLVTNLDRKAIEGKLAEVRSTAQAANLKELPTCSTASKACRARRSSRR